MIKVVVLSMIANIEPTRYAKKPQATIIHKVANICSIGDVGYTSPYPTVVIVVKAQEVVITYRFIGDVSFSRLNTLNQLGYISIPIINYSIKLLLLSTSPMKKNIQPVQCTKKKRTIKIFITSIKVDTLSLKKNSSNYINIKIKIYYSIDKSTEFEESNKPNDSQKSNDL